MVKAIIRRFHIVKACFCKNMGLLVCTILLRIGYIRSYPIEVGNKIVLILRFKFRHSEIIGMRAPIAVTAGQVLVISGSSTNQKTPVMRIADTQVPLPA